MTKTAKPHKITHAIWAQLQTGLISAVHHDRASLRIEGGQFVMRGPSGQNGLDVYQTSAERLDAHWQSFATTNA